MKVISLLKERIYEKLQKRRSFITRGEHHYYFPELGRVETNLLELLEIYKKEPMIQRAIDKRAKDLVVAGFKITGYEPEEEHVIDDINDFIERTRLLWKLSRAIRDALVYGNGFLEKGYSGDRAASDRPPTGKLKELYPMSPLNTIIVEERNPDSPRYGEVVGYLSMPPMWYGQTSLRLTISREEVGQGIFAQGKFLHRDRVIHIKFNSLSDSHLGMSVLEPMEYVMRSKVKMDEVIGTIVYRHGKPIIKGVGKGANPKEIRKMGKLIAMINKKSDEVSHLIHDDMWEFEYMGAEGKALRPKEYMDYIERQIATSIGVPRTLLIGAEQGSISGSEINLIAYFQSLESDQKTILAPIIIDILESYLGKQLPRHWKIEWNRLYADEISALKISFMNTQSIANAVDAGLIPVDEARKKLCEIIGIKYSEDEEDYRDPKKRQPKLPTPPQAPPEGQQEGEPTNQPQEE